MAWWYLVVWIVAFVAAYALMPRPRQQRPPVQEINAPTAQEGREIPVLFGSRYITGPNVVWYGDVTTTAIKEDTGKK